MSRRAGLAELGKLGRLLRQERKSAGVSVYRLSKESGLSQQTIHNLESGKGNPTLGSLLRVANALKIDLPGLMVQAIDRPRR